MAEVRFQAIRKTFGKVTAVDDVDLTVGEGEFVVLLGPSGCGKTTLLRCLAGLERVDRGRVFIGDRDVTELPPRKRRISMVFQSYAVFPHMTVRENIAFGLRRHKETDAAIKQRVESVSELLGITELLDRYPAQISGGQRQRVAVARAIAVRTDVLLMDEPLSNLDALLRMQMRAELKALLRELGTTTIYVTHDQTEALSMGDRIAVMNRGHIVQVDTPLRGVRPPGGQLRGRLRRHTADEFPRRSGGTERRGPTVRAAERLQDRQGRRPRRPRPPPRNQSGGDRGRGRAGRRPDQRRSSSSSRSARTTSSPPGSARTC